jgi:signal transduction histidine kinase
VACYRIAQEGLTNVLRHAHAHSCTVYLTCGEQLTIEIIDDALMAVLASRPEHMIL